MTPAPVRSAVVAAVVLAVSLVGLAGPAMAADGSSLEVDVAVSGPGGGGDGTMDCEGDPAGKHECDKQGNMSGGPFQGSYEGFNDGNSAGGPYEFGDDFDFQAFGQPFGLAVTCSLEQDLPSENPCPAQTSS